MALAIACSSCATPRPSDQGPPVRAVDFKQAPELKDLAAHARSFGDRFYPKVQALFGEETTSAFPFDLVLGPIKSGNTGEAHLRERRIYINSEYLTNAPNSVEHFEKVFVHEMTHIALGLQHSILGIWYTEPSDGRYWGESLADYARFKLLGTNGWSCPECGLRYPHYTSGYTCGGGFLLHLDARYGADVIRQLARSLQRRNYSDKVFEAATGKSLTELWAEFEQTEVFRPIARDVYALQQRLGFRKGVPPKDVVRRFDQMVRRDGDAFAQKFLAAARSMNKQADLDIEVLSSVFLYLMQPGGPAERALFDLRDHGKLPGFAPNERGSLNRWLSFDEISSRVYPQSRTITLKKEREESSYHYQMARASSSERWELKRAWRTAPDGATLEEYRLP